MIAAKAAPSGALLTVTETAERLRAKPAKIRSLARRGELAFVRCGKSLLFMEADLAAFLERNRRPARAERGARALAEALK